MNINEWAIKHRVPRAALAELLAMFNLDPPPTPIDEPSLIGSEAAVLACVRLEASRKGWRLFRNNLGAGKLENGSFVRWGLCNDSAKLNESIKSSDLVGWTDDGRFVGVECKEPGWRYTGNDHEAAQRKWLELIVAAGGVGKFVSGPGQL